MKGNHRRALFFLLWIAEHGLRVPMLSTIAASVNSRDQFIWGWIVGCVVNDVLGGYRLGSTLVVLLLTLLLQPLRHNSVGIIVSAIGVTTLVAVLQWAAGRVDFLALGIFCCVSMGGQLWAGKRTASLNEIG